MKTFEKIFSITIEKDGPTISTSFPNYVVKIGSIVDINLPSEIIKDKYGDSLTTTATWSDDSQSLQDLSLISLTFNKKQLQIFGQPDTTKIVPGVFTHDVANSLYFKTYSINIEVLDSLTGMTASKSITLTFQKKDVILSSSLPDYSIKLGDKINIFIPPNSFIDPEYDPLIPTLKIESDNSGIPAWLIFDESNWRIYTVDATSKNAN